jgi:hypothetical protein
MGHFERDATVLGAAFRSAIAGHRVLLAVAVRRQHRAIDALAGKVFLHRLSAPL